MLNKYKTHWLLILSVFLAVIITACQSSQRIETDNKSIVVTVSILPQAYFVDRIGGDAVAINVMVGPGEEAHTYEPTPEQMRTLSESQVFFSIGVEYEESWIPRFKDIQPELTIVDTTAGIERIPLSDNHAHEEGQEEHDDGERMDPHVWLSPDNGKTIAQNILAALIKLAPEQKTAFQNNYETLISDIDKLNNRIETLLSGVEQRTFMVFHPAWGYFANQYSLRQIAVQIGGQDPSISELAALVEEAREENIRVIFIQPTFNSTKAETIAEEINGEIVIVDPLARDWLSNIETAANAFAATLNE